MSDHLSIQATDLRPERLPEFMALLETSQDFSVLETWSDSDIALMLESVSMALRRVIIENTGLARYWAILNLLQYDTAKHVHALLTESEVRARLTCLTDADVITFSELLSPADVDEYLLNQSEASVTHIQQALSYQDEQVGRFVVPFFLVANTRNSVGKIRLELAERKDNPVHLIIVVNRTEVVGVVQPHQLYMAESTTKMEALAVAVPLLQDKDNIVDVSQLVALESHITCFPVLTSGKLMGVLPLSILMNSLRELGHRAVVPENVKTEEDLFTPLLVSTRLRALWLIINLLTAFAASAIIGMFDKVVEQVVALAILMPVVASMGGIAGSQTLAVALRGIALNHLQQSNLHLLMNKEVKIALINGVTLGAVIACVVYFFFHSIALALIICCAISVNSVAAAVSGTVIPFTLKKLKIDPAIAGSVILTTVTDVIGFLVFLGLGALFLV